MFSPIHTDTHVFYSPSIGKHKVAPNIHNALFSIHSQHANNFYYNIVQTFTSPCAAVWGALYKSLCRQWMTFEYFINPTFERS
mmetsp:Transcript_19431/g.25677  ORF Transcript_19431/g.25677 Transcript_19431/m.25677 type:complete len:83 (-) Transcript_19431:611-859(-)